MTDQHPITPPPELVRQWRNQAPTARDAGATRELWIATQAARWGADQELEACCEWLCAVERWKIVADRLRSNRRPKPPSLKEQALADLDRIPTHDCDGDQIADLSNIRRALEQLDD